MLSYHCAAAGRHVLVALLLPAALLAQSDSARTSVPDTTQARALSSVRVVGRLGDLRGIASTASEGRVDAADLRLRPLTREGELLETVPGLIVTQHSGDGKANQYFVRGFNLDHGTDFQTRVDGVPVNMPSHAHGQGYTDLNFLIPELVDHVDYRLGVYHAELGDFGSAGGAEFHLARSLARPFASVEAGAFGYGRVAGGGSTRVGRGELLGGGEVKSYDGPWDVPQRLRKHSGLARYSWRSGASNISLLAMAYSNSWSATDQVPVRAVRSGQIGRFGLVDPTDGGVAHRYSLSGTWRHVGSRGVRDVQLFGVYSDLSLFSNFTYFLDDAERGDQFSQRERRVVFGGRVKQSHEVQAIGVEHTVTLGLETRTDLVTPVGLYRTHQRQRHTTVREDDLNESGTGLFVQSESRWRPWLRTTLGARADLYAFDVRSNPASNSGRRTAAIVSPKASIVLVPSTTTEVYLSGGLGFHSNDARGTTIREHPLTGDSASQVDPLVRSRGAEAGVRATLGDTWRSTLTVWGLELRSELVFVGDGGTTEPSDRSRRGGITWANSYRPVPQLSLDADISMARARFVGVSASETRIPGALEHVIAGGATWSQREHDVFGAVRVRHFGTYALIEDNSARADATTLVNIQVGMRLGGMWMQLTVLNTLQARASDIQYYYRSRLPGEPTDGVGDIHVHPVEPRQLRLSLSRGR